MAEELKTTTEGQETGTQETETKTYSEEEFQSEVDRRVTQALKKVEKKNQDKLKEAQKVANMDAQQKYEYELQQREEAIAEKEKQLALAENRNVCSKILADKGISLELVDFIVADDAETMNDNIKKLDKAFKASVKAEVEKRLGGKTPEKHESLPSTMTKEQFLQIKDASVLMQIKNEQPELWQELTK